MRRVITVITVLAISVTAIALGGQESSVAVYFNRGGDDFRKEIKEAISKYDGQVVIAIYDFTDRELSSFLKNTVVPDRKVRIVFGSKGGGDPEEQEICLTLSEAENVKIAYLSTLHHKFAVVGTEVVITGSANWSNNSLSKGEDFNNLVIIRNKTITEAYLDEFERLWDTAKREGNLGCHD